MEQVKDVKKAIKEIKEKLASLNEEDAEYQVYVQKLWEALLEELPIEERKSILQQGIHIEAGAYIEQMEEDFHPCLEYPEPY